MATPPDFKKHQKVGNDFILEEPLGAGQDGEVWHVTRISIGKRCAIKFLKTVTDAEKKARFEREIKILASLEHPFIVQVQEKGEGWNPVTGELVPYYVMEFLAAKPINKALLDIAKARRLDAFCILFRQIFSALEAAHAIGISHGDIKPANILVIPRELIAKLSDFGFGLLPGESKQPRTEYPGSSYKAPPDLTPIEADIYRLGRTLSVCLDALSELDHTYGRRQISALANRMSENPRDSTLSEAKEILEDIRIRTAQDTQLPPGSLSDVIPEFAQGTNASGVISDPIHGTRAISNRVLRIIDLDIFQRLRRIKQFPSCELVYPSFTVTAFEQALGEHAMLIRQLDALVRTAGLRQLADPSHLSTAIFAGLLISGARIPFQVPLSRALESRDLWVEVRVAELAFNSAVVSLIKEWNLEPAAIEGLVRSNPDDGETIVSRFLSTFLHGPLSPFSIDWVCRAPVRAGFDLGVNVGDILNALTVSFETGRVVVRERMLRAIESFYMARIQAEERLFYHPAVRAADLMLERTFSLLRQDGLQFHPLLNMNDNDFFEACVIEARRRENLVAGDLLTRYTNRRLHKRLVTINRPELVDLRRLDVGSQIDLADRISYVLTREFGVSFSDSPLLLDISGRRRQREIFVMSEDRGLVLASDISPSFAALEERLSDQPLSVYVPADVKARLTRDKRKLQEIVENTIYRALDSEIR
jgi:serine/threonine protein kinase